MTNVPRSAGVSFELDLAIFSLTSIKKVAYRFGDRCYVELTAPTENTLRITLNPKTAVVRDDELEGEFRNEVLDQDLRERVLTETEGVRNLLLAQAFSQTSLIGNEGEAVPYDEDPLGIRKSEQG